MYWDVMVDALQWPAMAITLAAAWCVGSRQPLRRIYGFRMFILSNVLWTWWGWNRGAYALIALQFGLFALNWRGAKRQAALDVEVAASTSVRQLGNQHLT